MKIMILGYSGSGKSTLAARLGEKLGCQVLHLDKIQFLPGWEERDTEEGCRMVADFMDQNDSWVMDGNYQKFLQRRRLLEADQIIFMDFPRRTCLRQALARYFANRNKTRASMAEGCKEKFDWAFLWWILRDGRTEAYRERYRKIQEEFPEKTVVCRNHRDVELVVMSMDTYDKHSRLRKKHGK